MAVSTHQVREDFDRIALLMERRGGERDTYHDYLLRCLPSECETALEVGCGSGAFTRLLAGRARRVTGVDLSPQMLRVARQRSAPDGHVEYVLGDIMQLELPREGYDCVVSIATLHHLPLDQALRRMKSLLKPGGVLVIHDLVGEDGLVDRCLSMLAMPVSVAARFWKTGQLLPPKEVREVWAEHGKHDVYLKPSEVKEMREQYLPGARVKRHLLWRYTVVWRKKCGAASEVM
jgi:ubiquinone/menaquinone biosynthesis C-methylase UbiE